MQRHAKVFKQLWDSHGLFGANRAIRKFTTAEGTTGETQSKESETKESKLGGFARSFEKFKVLDEPEKPEIQSFAALLRHSKFIDLGDPKGKLIEGEIYHITGDDLYIDFGWKFHCVCPRPPKNPENYVRGAKVKLRINDLELSSRFLGSTTDITLLEADCTLLGLLYTPRQSKAK